MRFSSCIGRSKTEWKSTVERLFPYEDTFVVQNRGHQIRIPIISRDMTFIG